jgi:hypothetical protein
MLSKRLSTMLLSGAALTGLGVSVANAGLLIDVRAISVNGVNVADPKNIPVVNVGDTVLFRVFADVTGTDGTLPDCFQSLSGSFLSSGGTTRGNLQAPAITAPFNGTGSSPGTLTDLDSDGDTDIGSNNPGDPAGFFLVRSGALSGPRSSDNQGQSVYPPGAAPVAIPGGTEYRLVTAMRMVITTAGSTTNVNFSPRLSNTAGVWALDATEVQTQVSDPNGDPATQYTYTGGQSFTDGSLVQVGTPVAIGPGGTVPEPASLGLAGLATLGLLGRRRK